MPMSSKPTKNVVPIVTVSLETMKIVRSLLALEIERPGYPPAPKPVAIQQSFLEV